MIIVWAIIGVATGFLFLGSLFGIFMPLIAGEGSWADKMGWLGWCIVGMLIGFVMGLGTGVKQKEKNELMAAQRRFFMGGGSQAGQPLTFQCPHCKTPFTSQDGRTSVLLPNHSCTLVIACCKGNGGLCMFSGKIINLTT